MLLDIREAPALHPRLTETVTADVRHIANRNGLETVIGVMEKVYGGAAPEPVCRVARGGSWPKSRASAVQPSPAYMWILLISSLTVAYRFSAFRSARE